MAAEETTELQRQRAELEDQAKVLLIPKDPRDDKNLVLEIRAGTGGEEAALFAGDLFRLYVKYAEKKGLTVDTVEASETGIGGYKNVVALVEGKGAYSHFKYEAGVHRVQRAQGLLVGVLDEVLELGGVAAEPARDDPQDR